MTSMRTALGDTHDALHLIELQRPLAQVVYDTYYTEVPGDAVWDWEALDTRARYPWERAAEDGYEAIAKHTNDPETGRAMRTAFINGHGLKLKRNLEARSHSAMMEVWSVCAFKLRKHVEQVEITNGS